MIYNEHQLMSKVVDYLEKVDILDKQFVGTIAFRSEELTLPDGSKIALGIDDGHWILIYQREAKARFIVYKYIQADEKIFVDQKAGNKDDILDFKKHVAYFMKHARVEELVTLLPTKK
ncbi:MAG: hypothetical protein ABIH22_04210 [Candidatus Margulisiibacteriota bacterium]